MRRRIKRLKILLLFTLLSVVNMHGQVNIGFTTLDTVCVNTPVNITNTTTGASNYYWNFCVADISKITPTAVNLGNPGGRLANPVFMDYVFYNNNYYGFSTNYNPGNLIRMDFGNSLLNTPTSINLGNFGGIIPPGPGAEGIQVVENEGKWYAIIVAGYTPSGSTPRILKIDFGSNLTNTAPIATNWGNLGDLYQPIDLHVFKENNDWYGFTVNAENNTITRFNFTNSFDNTPTAINLGNIGNLLYPTGIYAIDDNGFWRVFVVNGGLRSNTANSGNYSLTRLDFGNSLLNIPAGVNLGNPGNMLHHPRDLTIMKSCDQVIGFAVNGNSSYNNIVQLNFNNQLSSTPVITSFGNVGNLSFPHSISKLFRINNDLYSFVTNVANNSLTRLRFAGCSNASISSSSLQYPPAIVYNTPGTYNINLSVDEGLPTQSSVCRNVVVVAAKGAPLQSKTACKGDTLLIQSPASSPYFLWNTGTTASSIKVTSSGTYWVEYDVFNCPARDSFLVEFKDLPTIQARTDTSVCRGDSVRLFLTGQPAYRYRWTPSTGISNINIASPVAAPASTTSYIVTATDALGCTTTDTATIFVNALPVVTKSSDMTKCSNDSVQLTAGGGIQYEWSPSYGLAVTNIANPFTTTDKTIKYYVTVTGNNGCNAIDSVLVQIKAKSDFAISPANSSLCKGDSTRLTASGGDTYRWIGGSTGNSRSPFVIVSPSSTTVYTVEITETGCNISDTVSSTIRVNQPPSISLSKSNDIDCSLGRALLSASGAASYKWSPANGLSNVLIPNPVATPGQTTTYHVLATSAFGCMTNDSITVKVDYSSKNSAFLVANGFTPNDDGINDCFSVKNWGTFISFEMSVYNRWGQKVFFTKDPGNCWNGTYKGIKQQSATFVYQIKAVTECGSVYRNGTVVLMR
ncbi:MAG: gliding motility-associated C-terminal domain-containing protein [Chitinophagaceae bacterium]